MLIRHLAMLLLTAFSLMVVSCSAAEVPRGFAALGTTVPAEYDPPPTHDFTERAPDTHTGAYDASAEEKARGYVVYAKNYLESIYPCTTPRVAEVADRLRIFSAPGEYEPATFTIYALDTITDVSVAVGDLRGPAGRVVPANNVDVRSVRCWPRRVWKNPPVNEYTMQPWFLEKRVKLDIDAQRSQRFWVTVWTPPCTSAGIYEGIVKVSAGNRDHHAIRLSLEVLDVELLPPPTKQAIYYHMQDETNPELFQPYPDPAYYYKDVVNMKEHGLNAVHLIIPVMFEGRMEGDKAVFDLDPLAPFIGPCNEVGVDTVIFNMTLSQVLPAPHGPSPDYGVNVRGFVDSYVAQGWKLPILSYGDESDAGDKWPEVVKNLKMSKQVVPEAQTYTTIVYPWNCDKFEPYLDIRAHALPDWRVVEPARTAGRELWQYSGAHEDARMGRFYRGLWASVLGLEGMLDWLYFLVYNEEAFFDDLGGGASGGPNHRGYVFPTPDGPLPTPAWEGLREGIEDGKYLYTLKQLIKQAKASGNPELTALARQAQDYLDVLHDQADDIPEYERNDPFPHRVVCQSLTDVNSYNEFRYTIAGHIKGMQDKLTPTE